MSEQAPPVAVSPDIYSAEWCDGMGGLGSNELFVQSGGRIIRPRLAYALRLGAVEAGMRVLDIGCGRGEVVIKCVQVGAGLAMGLDYAVVPLRSARENAGQIGLSVNADGSSLALSRADAKVLPFEDMSFDRVFMLDIVEHLHEWELQQVWGEVRRVLKPDGWLVIHTLPNRWAMDCGYRLARLLVRGLPTDAPDKRDVFHVNEQSVVSLSRSLNGGGLRSRVWLHDLILVQADWWQQVHLSGEEAQTRVYSVLRRPVWRALYRLAVLLPTRLILSTDLFAIAWRSESPPSVLRSVPCGYAERAIRLLGDRGTL